MTTDITTGRQPASASLVICPTALVEYPLCPKISIDMYKYGPDFHLSMSRNQSPDESRTFILPPSAEAPSFDPNDEHFVDILTPAAIDDVGEYDATLVGEPYDGGQVGTRGAAGGPAALRRALAETKTYHLTNGAVSGFADLGDVAIPHGLSVTDAHEVIKHATRLVHESGAFPIFMGGGHDLGYPNVAPLIDIHDSVGVINFDSHADVREVIGEPHNGSPFRLAYQYGLDKYAFMAGGHFETSTPYLEYIEKQNGLVVDVEKVGNDPAGSVRRAMEYMDGVDAIHVSCDLDVLDMTVTPATTSPTPGGLISRELYIALRETISDPRVVSFGLIGCAPQLQSHGQRIAGVNVGPTAMAGGRAIAHVVSALQNRV
jgi:formimidoylglutamase